MTTWRPSTEAEEAMAAAVAAGDRAGYLRALSAEALYLPVTVRAAAGREPVSLATSTLDGLTYVPAWTSGTALPAGVEAVRRWPLFELVGAIAGLGWGIAVDPGLPVQAYLTPDAVRTLPPWEAEWWPLDDALRRAVAAGDREAYTTALLDASLLLPLPGDVAAPGEYWTAVRTDVSRDVTDPAFAWWRTQRADGQPIVLAFTSPAHLQAELGDRDWIAVPFVDIAVAWPRDGAGLRVNPGSGNGIEVPAEMLSQLYRLILAALHERNRAAS
ncbi:SseB family protein [Dactylosporangium sp. CS-033363]|uniref:SseB family protein n=1 Tax=Dactylosporangium sp. CS-033363 TaxID=3239935 RepID=UPI003D8CFB5A